MTKATFLNIMQDEDIKTDFGNGCNVFSGLKIITKYVPDRGIESADHDIIYSVDIDKLIEAGITKEDVTELRKLNWMAEDDERMACFV